MVEEHQKIQLCILLGRQEHEISFFLLLDESSGCIPRRSCLYSCQLRKVSFMLFSGVCFVLDILYGGLWNSPGTQEAEHVWAIWDMPLLSSSIWAGQDFISDLGIGTKSHVSLECTLLGFSLSCEALGAECWGLRVWSKSLAVKSHWQQWVLDTAQATTTLLECIPQNMKHLEIGWGSQNDEIHACVPLLQLFPSPIFNLHAAYFQRFPLVCDSSGLAAALCAVRFKKEEDRSTGMFPRKQINCFGVTDVESGLVTLSKTGILDWFCLSRATYGCASPPLGV